MPGAASASQATKLSSPHSATALPTGTNDATSDSSLITTLHFRSVTALMSEHAHREKPAKAVENGADEAGKFKREEGEQPIHLYAREAERGDHEQRQRRCLPQSRYHETAAPAVDGSAPGSRVSVGGGAWGVPRAPTGRQASARRWRRARSV